MQGILEEVLPKSSFYHKHLTPGAVSARTSRTMGQQLRQRTKQRRRILRKKRLKVRAREAAAKK
jgi:hypothetical protein